MYLLFKKNYCNYNRKIKYKALLTAGLFKKMSVFCSYINMEWFH